MGMKLYAFTLLLTAHLWSSLGCDVVPFTPVANAEKKLAVCMDGSRAGYHFSPGSGDGAKSWLLYMRGGGWCSDYKGCQYKLGIRNGSTKNITTQNFTGILSGHRDINPDFFNWNRVYILYCDQSSFLGDTEILDQGQNFQFRGSRIFDAVIDDMLAKGMKNAENALLAGESAGGLAVILHCDGFRARLPHVGRVKCLSDAGFFIRAKHLPHADYRENAFASVIAYHNISRFLSSSCTRRIQPSLCLFPEYLVRDVQTPLFILNGAFDYYQLAYTLIPQDSPEWPSWKRCLDDSQHCIPAYNNTIKDFGKTFLNTIRRIPKNPSRGVYIHQCFTHTVTVPDKYTDLWNPNTTFRLGSLTLREAVKNWYFDRSSVNLLEDHGFPQPHC